MVALAASNKEIKKGIEYMLTWVWQPGSLYEIRANWGWYWAWCGMVKIIIKPGGVSFSFIQCFFSKQITRICQKDIKCLIQ